jgi:hypothetical protein
VVVVVVVVVVAAAAAVAVIATSTVSIIMLPVITLTDFLMKLISITRFSDWFVGSVYAMI